jgi:hypothetical protein
MLFGLSVRPAFAGASNDGCSAATAVSESVGFSTLEATTDGMAHAACPDLVNGDDQIHNDVWFTHVSVCTGFLRVSTCEQSRGSADFDTRIAAYNSSGSCPPRDADLLGCNDDDPDAPCGQMAGGFHSTLQIPVATGIEYLIRVGGFDESESGVGTLAITCIPAQSAGWIAFSDATTERLIADSAVSSADVQEKDFAWGDVDLDGDIDLLCVRKEPWNTPGRFRNVLFINEGPAEGHAIAGVLVDRTAQYASSADDGGSGMLDPTADRDAHLIDVDGDGWLDIVTSTTYGEGQPKTISHPRVYINLRDDGGAWAGFRYEQARTPQLPATPHFCGVGAGDVTGDGFVDLYFVDYNNTLEDRLWINDGFGFFVDESDARLTTAMRESDFGVHAVIADMNGDGRADIVKDRGSTLTQPPLRVSVIYNDPAIPGFFNAIEHIYNGNPYHTEVADLNNDGLLDLVIEDDGTDRYLINQGNGPDGYADFVDTTFATGPDSFGGNILVTDLDVDGYDDVLIADVDVDCCGCTRSMRMWRNLGDIPSVTFELHDGGIPLADRTGTHDVASFDINGDDLPDLVLGTCTGMSVWIQQPPVGLALQLVSGFSSIVTPAMAMTVTVNITGPGGVGPEPGSAMLHVSIDGAPYVDQELIAVGGTTFEGILPPVACHQQLSYYFSASDGADTTTLPSAGSADAFKSTAAFGTIMLSSQNFESGLGDWLVENDPSLTSGAWTVAVPSGTSDGSAPAAPDADSEPGGVEQLACVTGNGTVGQAASDVDVDGGPTMLVSPAFDLTASDAIIRFDQWFYSSDEGAAGGDALFVEVSANDGQTWWPARTTTGTRGRWETVSFQVGAIVSPGPAVRVRFSVEDQAGLGASIVEAGIDRFRVERLSCTPCALNGDCADGLFCNGSEICQGGGCVSTGDPCTDGTICDDVVDECVACLRMEHCDDGLFCNGVESCVVDSCIPGSEPCPVQVCNESTDLCADCLDSSDCQDGVYCNGVEQCVGGLCQFGSSPCLGVCDEGLSQCVAPALQPRLGDPLTGLTLAQLARFEAGKVEFNRPFTESEGLGPGFNQISCAACHNNPIGGSGTITVQRFGVLDTKTGMFDALANMGGSLLQANAISDVCTESIPPQATVQSTRATSSTLGAGLIEALPDAALLARAITPPAPAVSGRVHQVALLEDPGGPTRVGRFGWKAQVATVLTFSADAALNEMGITNALLPEDNAPNGDAVLLSTCDAVADPEDAGIVGERFIDRITDFQRYLAGPPQTPRSGMTGELLFEQIGCADCHAPLLVTDTAMSLEAALRGRGVKPYSDFLLHDMGALFDGIVQGDAQAGEIRTPPLWGLRVRDPMLHDGSVAGGTFSARATSAIVAHGGIGSEASTSVAAFVALDAAQQDDIILFLDSLGRAEFDHDGDNDVDVADFVEFKRCYDLISVITPDDPCAVSDFNQNGDVEDMDFAMFLQAVTPAGLDCDADGAMDYQQLLDETAEDCNGNGLIDACDVVSLPVDQWANSVVDFSSQFSSTAYSATQAVGPPDTFTYGANPTTWSPLDASDGAQFITVAYDTPVFAEGATIRETEGNGFVVQVDVLDEVDSLHTVWVGLDPSAPGTPVDFGVSWPLTQFRVRGLRITIDTDHDPGWESIDAIQMHGRQTHGSSFDNDEDGVPDECQCRFGDIVFNGIVDIDDILCVLNQFAGGQCGLSADVVPCTGGNGVVDVADIVAILDAFAGVQVCAEACP